MKNIRSKVKFCIGLGAVLFSVGTSSAAYFGNIYENSGNPPSTDLVLNFAPGTVEVGDQIILAGTERNITSFTFDFYGIAGAGAVGTNFVGNVTARIRFYTMTGPNLGQGVATPGPAFFWDSGDFSIFPTPRSTAIFTLADFGGQELPIPGGASTPTITWSVQFSGMFGGDEAGVNLYNPPSVGGNYDDYWEYNAVLLWQLKTNSLSTTMNFGATMNAVPEPSTVALLVCGGLGLLLASRKSRKA